MALHVPQNHGDSTVCDDSTTHLAGSEDATAAGIATARLGQEQRRQRFQASCRGPLPRYLLVLLPSVYRP
jgi:hypothetical protein